MVGGRPFPIVVLPGRPSRPGDISSTPAVDAGQIKKDLHENKKI